MPEFDSPSGGPGPWTTTLIALFALGLVLADVWLRRRHRMRVWVLEPRRLLEQPPAAGLLPVAAVPAALLALGAAVPHFAASAFPFTAWLAALALLGAGHLREIPVLGAAGLLAAALGVAAVPAGWFGAGPAAGLIGLPLGALWMLWLTQFWKQQLSGGRAWTTTGRLIPAARACAVLLAGGMLLWTLRLRMQAEGGAISTVSGGLASGLQILLVLAFWRRALLDNNAGCALGGCLAATSAVLVPWIPGAEPLFLLALTAALAVFAARYRSVGGRVREVLQPFVLLWIPCVAVLVALASTWSGMTVLGLVLVGLAAAGGIRTLGPKMNGQTPDAENVTALDAENREPAGD